MHTYEIASETLAGDLAAQGVIGPGAQERVMDVARKYACPVQ